MKERYAILTKDGELYHYGVPGMKWGHKKSAAETSGPIKGASKKPSKKPKASASRPINKPKDNVDIYFEKTKQNAKIRRAGYGAKMAGTIMQTIGQQQYDKYKDSSTTGRTAVMNILGFGGKALQDAGSAAVMGSQIKQITDWEKYWR